MSVYINIFCLRIHLYIANTLFPNNNTRDESSHGIITWISPDGQSQNQTFTLGESEEWEAKNSQKTGVISLVSL